MKCERIKQKIDELIFENNEMFAKEDTNHITNCNSCRSYLDESISANSTLEQMKKEPKLHNPDELTNNILSIIENVDQIPRAKIKNNYKIIRLARRSLAVASVGLILIFGIEQYIVFDKIQKLEDTTSKIANEQINISYQNVILYNTGMQIESFKEILNKEPNKQFHRKIKIRIILARLSALSINEIDNLRIRQLRQAFATMKSN